MQMTSSAATNIESNVSLTLVATLGGEQKAAQEEAPAAVEFVSNQLLADPWVASRGGGGGGTAAAADNRSSFVGSRSNSFVSSDAASDRSSSSRSSSSAHCAHSSLWSLSGSVVSSSSSSSSPSSSPTSSQLSSRSGSSSNWMMIRGGLRLVTSGGKLRLDCSDHTLDSWQNKSKSRSKSKSKSEGIGSAAQSCADDASEINIAHNASRPTPISTSSTSSTSSSTSTCSNNKNNTNYNNNDNDNNNDDEIDNGGLVSCASEDELATDCCNQRQSSGGGGNGSYSNNQFNTYPLERPCLLERHKHSSVCDKLCRRREGEIITPAAKAAVAAAAALAINNADSIQRCQPEAVAAAAAAANSSGSTGIEHDANSPCLDHNYYDTKTLFSYASNSDAPLATSSENHVEQQQQRRQQPQQQQQQQDGDENKSSIKDKPPNSGNSIIGQQSHELTRAASVTTTAATVATPAIKGAARNPAGAPVLAAPSPLERADQKQRQQQQPESIGPIKISDTRQTWPHSSRNRRLNATEGQADIGPAIVSARSSLLSLQQSLAKQEPEEEEEKPNLQVLELEHQHQHQQQQQQQQKDLGAVVAVAAGHREPERKKEKQEAGRLNERLAHRAASELPPAMEHSPSQPPRIINSNPLEDRLQVEPPKTYPNNTILVDLSKCHGNIAHLLPHPNEASASRGLSKLAAGCWPPMLRPASSCRARSASDGKVGKRRRGRSRSRGRRSHFNYQMPDLLLRANVTLKQEDYDKALSVLSSDVRFQLHLLLYRRVQTIWMLLSTILCILVPVFLANFEWLMIVGACCLWLVLQIVGAFVTTQFREKLDQMLEKSVAQVNTYFMEHNLMLGVINVGGLLSKAKLIIPVLYFDTSQCREQIESIISIDSRNDADGNNNNNNNNSNKHILDYTRIDLPLTKPNVVALAQSLAKKVVLRYSQRWISYYNKRKLMFNDDQIQPRHLSTGKCLCQFIEEHFRNNPNVNLKQQQQQQHHHTHNQHTTGQLKATSSSGHPETIQIAMQNNYNADQHQQPEEEEQEDKEAQVKTQVIRKTTQAAPTTIIPTLSRLVSLKESPPEISLAGCNDDLESGWADQVAQKKKKKKMQQQQQQVGALPFSWYMDMSEQQNDNNEPHQLQRQRRQQQQQQPGKVNGAAKAGETPVSSPDLSLEMGGESISRSDELVRKLRLLLELRQNELQGIDGSLFSGVLYKTPQSNQHQFHTGNLAPNDIISRPGRSAKESSNLEPAANGANEDSTNRDHHTTKTNEGKRFYTQREGLFLLGSNGAKKIQRDTNNKANHVLEIC